MQISLVSLQLLLSLALYVVTVRPAALPEIDPKTITDQTWKTCFDKLKGVLKERMSIPSFSFQIVHHKKESMPATSFTNVSLSEVQIKHANNYSLEIARVDLDELNFVVTILFPQLNLTGKYAAYTNETIHLNANGDFSFYATKFLLYLNITLDTNQDDTLILKYFTVNYSAVHIKSNIDNVIPGNDLVDSILNEGINEFVPVVINTMKPEVQVVLNDLAHVYGEFLVDGMTRDQLIDLVNSTC